jgi:hypothetical protein
VWGKDTDAGAERCGRASAATNRYRRECFEVLKGDLEIRFGNRAIRLCLRKVAAAVGRP